MEMDESAPKIIVIRAALNPIMVPHQEESTQYEEDSASMWCVIALNPDSIVLRRRFSDCNVVSFLATRRRSVSTEPRDLGRNRDSSGITTHADPFVK